jgi:hypothetical protein
MADVSTDASETIDLRAIFQGHPEALDESIPAAFHAYDTEQFVHVTLSSENKPVILSKFNCHSPAAPNTETAFYDSRSHSTFTYDHVNQVCLGG